MASRQRPACSRSKARFTSTLCACAWAETAWGASNAIAGTNAPRIRLRSRALIARIARRQRGTPRWSRLVAVQPPEVLDDQSPLLGREPPQFAPFRHAVFERG